MDLAEFAALHTPALQADEVRFNQLIAAIAAAAQERPADFRHWTLGAPGHCAVQRQGRAILLGNLDETECRQLARATMEIDYPGVVGSGRTPGDFVEHASALGARFEDPIPQRIHVLCGAPRYPGAPGAARTVDAADAPLVFEWLTAFHREAVPHDPPFEQASAEMAAAGGRYLFWTVAGVPVSVATSYGACSIPGSSRPSSRRPSSAGGDMPARRRPRSPSGSSRKAGRPYASIPTCAIPYRTGATPGSASGRTAMPGTICETRSRKGSDPADLTPCSASCVWLGRPKHGRVRQSSARVQEGDEDYFAEGGHTGDTETVLRKYRSQ